MNDYTFAAITNVALIILIMVGIYITNSCWPLWALLFLHINYKSDKDE